jgi:hypothetical protein
MAEGDFERNMEFHPGNAIVVRLPRRIRLSQVGVGTCANKPRHPPSRQANPPALEICLPHQPNVILDFATYPHPQVLGFWDKSECYSLVLMQIIAPTALWRKGLRHWVQRRVLANSAFGLSIAEMLLLNSFCTCECEQSTWIYVGNRLWATHIWLTCEATSSRDPN